MLGIDVAIDTDWIVRGRVLFVSCLGVCRDGVPFVDVVDDDDCCSLAGCGY